MQKVSLFITCLADTFYPRAGIGVVKVLEHLGYTVDFPREQTCCGQPLWNNGYRDDARELAKRMVRVFEDAECVVTPSGSCCAMIRDYYMELLEDDPAYKADAKKLIDKTYEFVEFLTKVAKIDPQELNVQWKGKVTYHYSCHLRGLGMTTEASDLLQKIDGIEYTEAEKIDQCCGFGGTFAMKFSDVSGAMVEDKVQCLSKTGADTVVSNDAGCTMNIAGACRRRDAGVGFKHISEILAEGLGLLEKTP